MPERDTRKSSPDSYGLVPDIEERLAERDRAARYEVIKYIRLARTRILPLYLRFAARRLMVSVASLVHRISAYARGSRKHRMTAKRGSLWDRWTPLGQP